MRKMAQACSAEEQVAVEPSAEQDSVEKTASLTQKAVCCQSVILRFDDLERQAAFSNLSTLNRPERPQSASRSSRLKDVASASNNERAGFRWKPAIKQYFLFLAVQHGFGMTQEKTRRELKGPFVKDYLRSVAGLGGWPDGGKFFTNYVAHPMGGAVYGFIQVQNDTEGIRQGFDRSKKYWVSRLKAMAWSAACSTQFEIGPFGQAAIGNVGLHTPHSGSKKRKMAYVDLVITPIFGTGWLVGEDALDRYVMRRLEKRIGNPFLINILRMLINPMRGGANLLRMKGPWHRDY
jgi:hypothetical protein